MLKRFIRLVGGDPNKHEVEKLTEIVHQINLLEPVYESKSDQELSAQTQDFKRLIEERTREIDDPVELKEAEKRALEEILPDAYAIVREASKRTIGLRHFDVQMIGGIVLHQGKIAEMRTGEGKTLVATLPIYLNALVGKGVHLITVNDYLARRDARWMAPIYSMLGLSVGVLQMAARTENGKKAFLVDFERESPHEDQNQLIMVPRAEAYLADITYGTNSEFGFDYLRDNMTMSLAERVQRGHYYAIIDEVDNVLIDEARTPLIISGPAQDEGEWYVRMAQVVKGLKSEDVEIEEKDRTVTLTELGEAHVEELLGIPLRDPERPEDVTPEQARLMGNLEQALRAQFLYRRNKEYLVQAGKVIIVDEFTGRMMPGRRWSDGLHQAVEAKEGVKVESESVTYATITIQNYFRMYNKLAGMSGTAMTESEEFDKIYSLGVLEIPTNLEFQALLPDSELEELDGRDEQGYKFQYYARKADPNHVPVFWRRKDYPDVVYRTVESKLRAICKEILIANTLGRPVLVGTTSVENSERLANRLRAEPLRRLAQVLVLRDAWIKQNDYQEDGRLIAKLIFLNTPLENLDVAEMRKLARELNVPFVPDDPANLSRLVDILELPESSISRLHANLQAGIPNQVLNARKHTEESQIIAGAGSFGAVTIATNMAGRGVDIKLGGELAEENIAAVNRILNRADFENAYEMTDRERKGALLEMDPANFGIYDAEIDFFLKHMDEMEQVRALGGLHVIGSERHEARRIDNQLRGRSARQGDPGSSRFFLSMEDDLMRLFGGQQADAMMQRLKIDDALPLEMGLVSRLIEQSQTRVEGANFDVRKHLLEYDDVLNAQRARIYSERNRIFTKADLTADVIEMLRTEVLRRVPEALKDESGPWKLIAWLDQIQPPISLNNEIFPSYTLKLLIEEVRQQLPDSPSELDLKTALLSIGRSTLQAEADHHLQAFSAFLDQALDRMEVQINERQDLIDTFFEGLELNEEGEERKPAELLADLSNAARLPLKLTGEQQKMLRDDPKSLEVAVRDQVAANIRAQTIERLLGTIEMRIGEPLEISTSDLDPEYWGALSRELLAATQAALQKRIERLVSDSGQIAKDLDNLLSRLPRPYSDHEIYWLLLQMPQGSKTTFDRRTHRRTFQRTNRLNYTYYAARFLEDARPEQIADEVLEHLEQAQELLSISWGQAEFNRLTKATLADLQESIQQELAGLMEVRQDSPLFSLTLDSLDDDQRQIITEIFGRRVISNIYRSLLLGVITELWVDYLTQMEALRVSIGLEAYAQRDPLVQYKGRASELFRSLQSSIQLGVISRMFTYRPRDLTRIQTGISQPEQLAPELETETSSSDSRTEDETQPQLAAAGKPDSAPQEQRRTDNNNKKRRRRRR